MAWQLLGYALPALTTIRTLGWEVAKRRFPKLTKDIPETYSKLIQTLPKLTKTFSDSKKFHF